MTNCHGLKMQAADGKMRFTDVADTEQLLRLIAPRSYAPAWERVHSVRMVTQHIRSMGTREAGMHSHAGAWERETRDQQLRFKNRSKK